MDYKKTEASRSTETLSREQLTEGTDNIYETISILAKRSDQINADLKAELLEKLEEFASNTESLEEIFENKEQIEVSKFYERLPKPALISINEWLNGKIYHRKPEEDKATE